MKLYVIDGVRKSEKRRLEQNFFSENGNFRASADLLYHQYGLELINVFDTMAAHIMVTNWVVETKVTRAKRLYCLVMDYLGVVSHQLPGPCFLDTGTLEKQMMMAARNCIYLPALSSIWK